MVAALGNQAENGENKPQPIALGETGLLGSKGILLTGGLTAGRTSLV